LENITGGGTVPPFTILSWQFLAVPLIIHYPGKISPQRIQSPLSLSQVPELIFQLLEEKNEAEILTQKSRGLCGNL